VLPLRGATDDLSAGVGSLPDEESAAVLEVVIGELRATMRDVLDLVDGVPPVELGEGRLVTAVTDLARRTPVRVEVLVEGDVCADGDRCAELATTRCSCHRQRDPGDLLVTHSSLMAGCSGAPSLHAGQGRRRWLRWLRCGVWAWP